MPKGLSLAILLAGYMGLREGEICGLQRRDVDLDGRMLHVRHAVKPIYDRLDGHRTLVLGEPKSVSSVRDLTIPDFLISPVRDQLLLYVAESDDAMLFPGKDGGMLAPQSLRTAWNRVRGKVPRLADMHFHDLRHTALTRLAEMGATGGELMAQAGHTSLKVASVYQQASDTHKAEVMARLNEAVAESRNERKPTATTKPDDSVVQSLQTLAELHGGGLLTDEEFTQAKARLLAADR